MNARPVTPRLPHGLLVLLGVAASYAVLGLASLWLAIPPGHASPLFPSAGIALVAVLLYGRRAAAATLLASFGIHWWASPAHAPALIAYAVPAALAVAAALQALAGAALVRRFVRQPLTLSEPRDIAAFFGFGAFVACLVTSSIGTAALVLSGQLDREQWFFTWQTWWMGDSLGTLVAAPIVLTLIGQPREEWTQRRMTVGLTLTFSTALMAATIVLVARWDDERVRNTFAREALRASSALSLHLTAPLHALEALRGLYLASDRIEPDDMRRATHSWLEGMSRLQAMGLIERVPRAEVATFEARQRAAGFTGYRVFDRSDGFTGTTGDVMALKYIEGLPGNAMALGVNVLSVPAARVALDSAVRTDRPAATAAFTLTQRSHGRPQIGIVIYHAVYAGNPVTVADRIVAARGAVFVTLRLEDMLKEVLDQLPPYLKVCIVDSDPHAEQRRLLGAPGCEAETTPLLQERRVAFAGRQWSQRIYAEPAHMPRIGDNNAWLFSATGLMAAALLGALLLTLTGRARRIEAAVRDRTAALQQEVHDREQAQVTMRESELRYRNIFNNLPIGLCYADMDGNVRQTNPRFCELVGYSAEELLTMTAAPFTHPDDLEQDIALCRQLARGQIPMYRRRKRYIHRSGRVFPVQSTVTLLRDENGRPSRFVGAIEDITEHLQLAEAERARAAAEASNLAKSEFLSRMSHELRTPLNAMLGFAQLLELDQNHPLPAAQRPWVAQIQSAGWHLLEMINDVLDLSRIESGTVNLQPDTLDLRELISAALPLVEQDAHRRGILVTQDLPENTARVIGDGTRVKQILINLLSNAVKYNSNGGRIHIATHISDDDNNIELIVTDTGLGMTTQQLAQLFQPFNRLGRERSALEGTGIGLVISQRLAELMGGALRAHSTAGAGSSFILSLPRAEAFNAATANPEAAQPVPSTYHQRTVHYVEDNETNVEVMRGILSRRPQVRLEVSVTGLDGLTAIRAHRPDLVLLDMHLPDIDGLELLRHLKADASISDIPVVVVSADALVAQMEAAMQAGAYQYLTKPVSVAQLLAVVDAILDRVETQHGDI